MEGGAKALELQGLKKGYEAPQDKIVGEATYANLWLRLIWQKAALNTLNKVHGPGEKIQPFKKVVQGLRERFTELLQILSREIELQATDSDSR